VALTPEWNVQPEILHYKDGTLGAMRDRAWLKKAQLDPWLDFRKQGGVMMVGEWGAHQHTPHDVLLRWAEDQLSIWKESDVGWALWNLHGSFGVLDSGRADVDYEEFRGAKLDRKLLELLQKY
jgi:endoglucanase